MQQATKLEPGLSIRGVSISFGGMRALDGVTLTAEVGSVNALIGPNGAGKTTLLNVISGVVRCQAGTVELGGKELTSVAPHIRRALGVGRTFQHAALFENLSVIENVMVGARRAQGHDSVGSRLMRSLLDVEDSALRERATQLLDEVEIGPTSTLPVDLPGGQRRLVGLARALIGDPILLLLDEISAGMTAHEKAIARQLIREFRRPDRIVLVIEHDIAFVREVTEHAFVLDRGRLIADESTEVVLADPKVVEAYVGV